MSQYSSSNYDSNDSFNTNHDRSREKDYKRKEPARIPTELFGYTNEQNPFNDDNLNQPFVWAKKRALEDGTAANVLSSEALQAKVLAEREEMEAIRINREKRKAELEEMRLLRANMKRDLDIEKNLDRDLHENEFHRYQDWRRTEIRLQENRPLPIDRLVLPLFIQMKLHSMEKVRQFGLCLGESEKSLREREQFIDTLDTDMTDISLLGSTLTSAQLTVLLDDIEALTNNCLDVQQTMEIAQEVEYWNCVYVVTLRWKDIQSIREKQQSSGKTLSVEEAQVELLALDRTMYPTANALPKNTAQHVFNLIHSKTYTEIIQLEKEVAKEVVREEHGKQIDTSTQQPVARYTPFPPSIPAFYYPDMSYWRALHNEIMIYACVLKLRSFSNRILKMRMAYIERVAVLQSKRVIEDLAADKRTPVHFDTFLTETKQNVLVKYTQTSTARSITDASSDGKPIDVDIEVGKLHAYLEKQRKIAITVAAEETVDSIMEAWEQSFETAPKEDVLVDVVTQGQEDGDEASHEVNVDILPPGQVYPWQETYRPRKPRFINKVRTGYAWHKYNRAHYDKDNPPPKVIQGYKFNLFYPDLVNMKDTPKFRITPDPDGNPDMCVLRFIAGAPYEDVAFKVVNRKWNLDKKSGYRCVFDKGVLTLWFNLARIGYRR